MEMHQIRYFLAVARTLNFTHAAEECHVAQPSLSRAIQKLEAEFGGELFRRERGLTHMTELGRLVLPLLTHCFESAIEAKKLAQAYGKGGVAPLRVGLSHTLALQILIGPLTELVRAFPGLELQFYRGTAPEVGAQLKAGDIELAIACPLPENWERLEAWNLFSEPLGLVVNRSHELANQDVVGAEQLVHLRLLPRDYCEQREMIMSVLEEKGCQPAATDRIASDHDLSALLNANVGVSIMPKSSSTADGLSFVLIDGLEVTRPVVAYAIAGRQRSQAASGLLRLLRAANWKKILADQRSPQLREQLSETKSGPHAA